MSVNLEQQLLSDISKMLENDSFHDVTIFLDEGFQDLKSVTANKAILCARSQFFANIFKSLSLSETKTITVKATKESMRIYLHFLYTGKIDYKQLNFKEVLNLVKMLKLVEKEDLVQIIEDFLLMEIEDGGFSTTNILKYAYLADDQKKVTDAILSFLFANLEEVTKAPEVVHLSCSQIFDLINFDDDDEDDNSEGEEIDREETKFRAIHSQSVKTLSYQIEKFQIFANWLSDGYGDVVGDHFKKKILTKFDLRAFTFHELSTCVRRSFLFSEEEILDAVLWKNCQLQIQMASLGMTNEKMKNELHQLKSQNTILKHLKSWSSTMEIQELERERECYKNLFEKEQKFVKYINNQFYFIDGRDLRHWQTPSNIEQIRAEFDRKCGPGS